MTFQINDSQDRKMIFFKQISIRPINLLVKLVNFLVTLNVTLPYRHAYGIKQSFTVYRPWVGTLLRKTFRQKYTKTNVSSLSKFIS